MYINESYVYIYINVFNAIDVTSYLFEKIIYEII